MWFFQLEFAFVYFAKYAQRKTNIPKLANVTSKLIEELLSKGGENVDFEVSKCIFKEVVQRISD